MNWFYVPNSNISLRGREHGHGHGHGRGRGCEHRREKYTSNSCQDAGQELTECLLKSLCEQTLQPIYYWREYLPKDELPQPQG